MNPVVLPEGPQHEARLVFLDRQGAHSLRIDPRKPRAARQAIRRVLVQEEPFLDQGLLAELEELARDVLVAGSIERVGDQRSVARPCVGVRVTGELRDVEICRRDDCAVVVGVRARSQDAAPVELRHIGAELFVDVAVILLYPHVPVGDGPAVIGVRPATHDQVLAVHRDLAQPCSHAHPVRERAGLHRLRGCEVEADGAVHRPLLDRVLAQDSVLRVDPGTRQAVALLAVGPRVDSELRSAVASDQEVAVALVRDDPAMARVESHRVADVGSFDEPVVMKEHAAGVEAASARDLEVADEPVAGEVDVVREVDGDPQTGMLNGHIADEGVLRVCEPAFPCRVVQPRELAVD